MAFGTSHKWPLEELQFFDAGFIDISHYIWMYDYYQDIKASTIYLYINISIYCTSRLMPSDRCDNYK